MTRLQIIQYIVVVVSSVTVIIGFILQHFPIVKFRTRAVSLQVTLFGAGVLVGLAYFINLVYGATATILVLAFILFGNKKYMLNRMFAGKTTTMISKTALFNKFCENIQRICQALLGPDLYPGDNIRVTLFQVDHSMGRLFIIGRYPLHSGTHIPDIEYKVGEGTSGYCAATGATVVEETLPSWNDDSTEYKNRLASKYNISYAAIERFARKSRCYYGIPIFERDPDRGVKVVSHVVSIDSSNDSIKSEATSSQAMLDVISAYIENNKDLLVASFIGFG
jgi:hypothetical protein